MTKRAAFGWIAAAVVASATSTPTRAEFITFEYSGEITHVSDRTNYFRDTIRVGDPFSGRYTFDSSTPDANPDPRRGEYANAIVDSSGKVGSFLYFYLNARRNAVTVENGFVSSSFDFYDTSSGVYFAGLPLDWGISLGDGLGRALSSDFQPLVAPVLPEFDSRSFFLGEGKEQFPFFLLGEVSNIALVPEPPAMLLLGLGALLLVLKSGIPRRGGDEGGKRGHSAFLVAAPKGRALFGVGHGGGGRNRVRAEREEVEYPRSGPSFPAPFVCPGAPSFPWTGHVLID